MKRILVISSREICYYSASFFANQLADAFEELGHQVTRIQFTLQDDLDAILIPLHGQNFDLIIDFNTQMCHLIDDDGPVLDLIGGPFFDYVLDHPLYHYNSLNADVKNLNAILLDRGQKAYVDSYYKKVKSSLFLPLSATEHFDQTKNTIKPERFLLMSTYVPLKKSYDLVKASPEPLLILQEAIIEMKKQNPLRTMEDCLIEALKKEETNPFADSLEDKSRFGILLNACYPAEAYIRNYYRDGLVRRLIKGHIPVTLVGEGWDKFVPDLAWEDDFLECCKIEKGLDFSLSFSRIAKEHLLLNNAPMFPDGMHDRVMAGFANHAAVLTDKNLYLEESFSEGKEIFFYDGKDFSDLADVATDLLQNPLKVEEAQEMAYSHFKSAFTWKHKAMAILSFLDKEN